MQIQDKCHIEEAMKRGKMRIQINLDQMNLSHLLVKHTVKVIVIRRLFKAPNRRTLRQESNCNYRLVSKEILHKVSSRCIKIVISWLLLEALELPQLSKIKQTKTQSQTNYRGSTVLLSVRIWLSKIKTKTLREEVKAKKEAPITAKWSQQASKQLSNASKCTVRKVPKRTLKTWTRPWTPNRSLRQPSIRASICRVIIRARALGSEFNEEISRETTDREHLTCKIWIIQQILANRNPQTYLLTRQQEVKLRRLRHPG